MSTTAPPAARTGRLLVHQFDPVSPVPGGIDGCIRDILKYLPSGTDVAVVGVDGGQGPAERRLGRWERHVLGETPFWFLPVARLDPAAPGRRMPHILRVLAGTARYWRRIPDAVRVDAHRMDTALVIGTLKRRPVTYFIHTQAAGLRSGHSDSFWRFAGALHGKLEERVVRGSADVIVFNADYAKQATRWNRAARFMPQWFDPQLLAPAGGARDAHRLVWVGRLEAPKDPALAIAAYAELVERFPDAGYTLEMLGSGTLLPAVQALVADLPEGVRSGITLRGRVERGEVAEISCSSGVFLMTSHPGYEGYPRSLVEALAAGLPAVVTHGSDTGGLVVDGITGYTCGREPSELALRIADATGLDRNGPVSAVAHLRAETLVQSVFNAPVQNGAR